MKLRDLFAPVVLCKTYLCKTFQCKTVLSKTQNLSSLISFHLSAMIVDERGPIIKHDKQSSVREDDDRVPGITLALYY